MRQNDRFDNILNECLDRVFKGETIENCLHSYPEQAKELEPLLRTAMAARVASIVQPRPEFKARARNEFQSALRELEARKKRRRFSFDWHPQLQWRSGWAIATLAIVVVLLGGGSTVVAASSAMPDSALYSIKLATEDAELAVTPSNIGKAELNAEFAEKRTVEINYMAAKGNAQEVRILAQRLNTNLKNITYLTEQETGLIADASGAVNNGITSAAPAITQTPAIGALSAPAPAAPLATPPPPSPAAVAPQTTEPPSSDATPTAPVIVNAPTPNIVVGAGSSKSEGQDSSSQNQGRNNKVLSSKIEQLKKIITDNFNKRQAQLEETLKKAPPDVRPAVRQAIAQSQNEYNKAIMTLEEAENGAG